VTFRESFRKANEGPYADSATHGLGEFIAAIWYWIAGEPVSDDDPRA